MKLTAPWIVLLLFSCLAGGIVLIVLREPTIGLSIVTPTLLLIGEVVRSQMASVKKAKKHAAVQQQRVDIAEHKADVAEVRADVAESANL